MVPEIISFLQEHRTYIGRVSSPFFSGRVSLNSSTTTCNMFVGVPAVKAPDRQHTSNTLTARERFSKTYSYHRPRASLLPTFASAACPKNVPSPCCCIPVLADAGAAGTWAFSSCQCSDEKCIPLPSTSSSCLLARAAAESLSPMRMAAHFRLVA